MGEITLKLVAISEDVDEIGPRAWSVDFEVEEPVRLEGSWRHPAGPGGENPTLFINRTAGSTIALSEDEQAIVEQFCLHALEQVWAARQAATQTAISHLLRTHKIQ